jgi:Tol biopolymer transport system component
MLALAAVSAGAQDAKVGRLPADAQIIFASKMAGDPDATGLGIADELYVATAKGKHVTRITYSRWSNNHFDVSPDRTMIVTNRMDRGDTAHEGSINPRDYKDLWIIDLVHGREYKIAPGLDAGIGGVAWSSDSKYVYFAARSDDGMDIYRVSPTPGDKPVVLTRNLNTLLGLPDTKKAVTDVGSSPDGKWLAMLYVADQSQGRKVNTRIVLFKLDGTEARILTDGGPIHQTPTGIWPNGDFDPDISPGDRYVAFERNTKADWSKADVFRVKWDGTGLLDLSVPNNPNVNGIPSWSAGCRVIYSVWTKTGSYAEIVNWDGTGRYHVPLPNGAHHVQWIPDGGGGERPSKAC